MNKDPWVAMNRKERCFVGRAFVVWDVEQARRWAHKGEARKGAASFFEIVRLSVARAASEEWPKPMACPCGAKSN